MILATPIISLTAPISSAPSSSAPSSSIYSSLDTSSSASNAYIPLFPAPNNAGFPDIRQYLFLFKKHSQKVACIGYLQVHHPLTGFIPRIEASRFFPKPFSPFEGQED